MHSEMSSIGDRIKRARKASGLSLRELGEQIGISHTAVSKYENGLITASSTMLIKLARALGVRVEYFLRPAAYELSNIEYRKMQGLSKSELGAIEFDVMEQIERLFELESLIPSLQSKFQKMQFNSSVDATSYDDIETIADEVRSDWGLGLGSISNLVEVIIDQGIRVIFTTVPIPARFDGSSAMVGETHLIVVSKNITGDRHRFTLAHELGHVVLVAGQSISPDLDMERACNRFAGALLLPKATVVERLGASRRSIDVKELSLLKAEFGLSMAGILYRALDLGILGRERFKAMMIMFRKNGWSKVEPGEQYPPEIDYSFQQLIFRALSEEYIGSSKAAELLGISIDEFNEIHDFASTCD